MTNFSFKLLAFSFQLLLGARIASAQTVVSVGAVAPEDTPWHKQLMKYKTDLEKASGGAFKVKMFMGGAKGGEDALGRQCAQGSLQMVGVTTGAMESVAPELDAFEVPYMFRNYEEADRALDDPRVVAKVREILAKKGLVFYFWSENGWRHFASKGRAIRTPADLKGMKMRSQESKVHIEMWKTLAASPVPISTPEVLSALQTGVVDGFDNTALFAFAASWYQGVKHWTVSDHIYQPAAVVYSKVWFDKLPKDQQDKLMADPGGQQKYGRKLIRAMNGPLLENLTASGIEVIKLSDAEKDAFAKALAPVAGRVRPHLGAGGAELLDLIKKAGSH